MEAGKRTIGQIFAKTQILEIPFFQRSYVWDKENWEIFLDDVDAVSTQKTPYFMGCLILKQEESSSPIRLLIDGQQRLTTIILFFKAVCTIQDESALFNFIFCDMKKEVVLRHNHNDIEIFESIVKEGGLSESLEEKYANRKILQCYKFFQAEENREIMHHINLNDILNKLYFLGIDLGVDDDEQQIFDTVNSLGVRLSTAELLKNELFRRENKGLFDLTWRKQFEGDTESKEFWEGIVTSGRLIRANIDMLLQAYLLIRSKADKNYIGLGNQIKSFKAYLKKEGIKRGDTAHENFVKELMKYADKYQKKIDPQIIKKSIDNSPLDRLNVVVFGLNSTTVIPYMLYILKNADSDNQDKMFSLLESYIVRREICKESSKNYNKIFASLIQSDVKDYDGLREKIYGYRQEQAFPHNESLKKGFANSNLINQKAKTVLYLMELAMHGENDAVGLLGWGEYSLEHVMPKKWRNNWLNNLKGRNDRERDQRLLKFGNLTIIRSGMNGQIQDFDWETKKNGRGTKKGLIEHSAGIKIFEKFLNLPDWNEDEIEKRGNFLFERAVEIWPYEE